MVQVNPVPVFGAKKKYQYHLTEIFHRNFRTNGKRSLSCVLVLQKPRKKSEISHFSRRSCAVKAKKCTKKRDARAELLFFLIKPVAFLPFSLPSPSSLLIKLSDVKFFWQPLKDIFSRYSSGPEEGLLC